MVNITSYCKYLFLSKNQVLACYVEPFSFIAAEQITQHELAQAQSQPLAVDLGGEKGHYLALINKSFSSKVSSDYELGPLVLRSDSVIIINPG